MHRSFNPVLILNTAQPHRFVALLHLWVLHWTGSSYTRRPVRFATRIQDGGRSPQPSGVFESLSPAVSLQHHTRRGKLAEWHHGATHDYHVNVGSEPALGFTALTPTPSYFLHVRVSLFMCVWFSPPPSFMFAFDAEWQGNPEPPTFSCCLYFSSPLCCSVLAHLASVNSPRTFWDCMMEALRYLIHHGLCNVKRAHYARPHPTATASGSTYPMNLFSISPVYVCECSDKGKDKMWMTFGPLHLSCRCAARFHVCCHLQKPGKHLCRGRHVS